MRNFTIILFIFFVFFLIISLFALDMLPFFLTIFFAFLLCFICLGAYLGPARGISIGIIYIFLPFLLEYLANIYNVPFFEKPLITNLTLKVLDFKISLTNLFLVFSMPLLFMSSLFFAHKIKLLADIKTYHKTFLIITSSLLLAINFLLLDQNKILYQDFIKWLIIALIINSLIAGLYKFKKEKAEIFKEAPIIIYLAILGSSALKRMDSIQLIASLILTIYYLIILFNEYKIRKIRLNFPF